MSTSTETKIIEIRVESTQALERMIVVGKEIDSLNKELQTLTKTYKEGTMHEDYYVKRKTVLTAAIKAHRQEVNTLSRELVNNVKQTKEKLGYIQKLEAEVSNLTLKYKQLSQAELSGAKGDNTLTLLKNKREELAKLNQAYGNYTHDVGNYAKGTNQLSIMMGQVMKEAPNFAISARIGIMSLSNNLVPLAEAIKAVKLQNVELAAQGKAIQSIMKTVGQSIFGLTGILSMVVVLFQLFGEDIIKFIGNMFKANTSIRQTTEALYGLNTAQQVINKTMKDGGGVYGDAVKSIEEMSVQLKAAKGNHDEEIIVLDKYNKGLGENFGKATSVAGALSLIASKKDAYIDAMMKMAFANAFLAKSSEDIVKQVDVMTKSNAELLGERSKYYVEEIANLDKIANSTKKRLAELVSSGATEQQIKVQTDLVNEYDIKQNKLRQKYNEISQDERNKQITDLKKHQGTMSANYENYYNEYLTGLENAGIKSGTIDKKTTKGLKDELNNRIEDIKYYTQVSIEELEKLDASIVKEFTKAQEIQYKSLGKDVTGQFGAQTDVDVKAEQDAFNNRKQNFVNFLSDKLDIANGNADLELAAQIDILNLQNNQELAAKELTEEQITAIDEKYKKKREQLEVDTTAKKLNGYIQYASAVAGIMEGAFAFTNALAQSELSLWAKQNKGKANFDEEYAKKKAEIDHKQAVRNKVMQVINSLINGASAVVSLLHTPPLAVAAGIAAALQTAAIIATPIPDKDATSYSGGSSLSQPPDLTSKMASPLTNSVNAMQATGGSNVITSGAANSSKAPSFDYNAMANIMSKMPAPELSIVELRTKEKQVDFIDNVSTIKS